MRLMASPSGPSVHVWPKRNDGTVRRNWGPDRSIDLGQPPGEEADERVFPGNAFKSRPLDSDDHIAGPVDLVQIAAGERFEPVGLDGVLDSKQIRNRGQTRWSGLHGRSDTREAIHHGALIAA
jgi:hypothetical protein